MVTSLKGLEQFRSQTWKREFRVSRPTGTRALPATEEQQSGKLRGHSRDHSHRQKDQLRLHISLPLPPLPARSECSQKLRTRGSEGSLQLGHAEMLRRVLLHEHPTSITFGGEVAPPQGNKASAGMAGKDGELFQSSLSHNVDGRGFPPDLEPCF